MKNSEIAAVYEKISRLSAISQGFSAAVVITTAAGLELFTMLHQAGPLDAAEIAARLGLDRRATELFLHALVGMGLLEKRDGKFTNSELADELLVKGSPYYQGDILRHNGNLLGRWIRLPEVLKTGKPVEGYRPADDRTMRRNFILGMANNASLSAQKVAAVFDLSAYRKMLDLGGGPGTYAIAFCRLNPQLSAVIFDLPEVIDEITADQVASSGLTERIGFIRGDYLNDDLGKGYDFIFISNIIHSLGEEENRLLLGRAFKALEAGGRVVVKDFLLDENRAYPPHSSMFALNMLLGTRAGRTYTLSEMRDYLAGAGFCYEKLIDLTPQARMAVAVKP
jgi:ubiquinone/menaquinone biosynthesis C-methylase UbiE